MGSEILEPVEEVLEARLVAHPSVEAVLVLVHQIRQRDRLREQELVVPVLVVPVVATFAIRTYQMAACP